MNPTTPGYKTTEFWLSLLAIAMPFIQGLTAVPTPWISLPAAAVAGAYALSRSQVKKGQSIADGALAAAALPQPVAPSVLAAAADAAARALPAFGAMTQDELARARAANAAAASAAATPPATTTK